MVQIIPRAEEERPVWMNILFFLSIGSLFLSAAAFFILSNLQGEAEQEIAVLDASLAKEQSQEFLSTEKDLKALKAKMQDFTTLFQGRENPLVPLALLESHTHPKTFFKTLSFDAKTGEMQLDGVAETFQAVEEQLVIFRQMKGVGSVDLANLGFSSGGDITYQVHLLLPPAAASQ